MPEVTNNLREIRQRQGRTITWLAGEIGMSRNTVYALEEGYSPGTLETWISISRALGVPLDELAPDAAHQVNEALALGKA